MAVWYYRFNADNNADNHGPISSQELLKLIRDGVVNEDTLIRKDDSNWVPSVDINGLWAAAGRPSAAFQCPNCGKPISKPPVNCGSCNQRILHAVGHLVQPKKSISIPTNLNKTPASTRPLAEGPSASKSDRSETTKAQLKNDRSKRSWFGLRKGK